MASGFAEQESEVNTWKVGDERWVNLTEREYQGKVYWNFRPAREGEVKLFELEARVKELEDAVFVSDADAGKKEPSDDEIVKANQTLDELPF